jgi:hypothetical protein
MNRPPPSPLELAEEPGAPPEPSVVESLLAHEAATQKAADVTVSERARRAVRIMRR